MILMQVQDTSTYMYPLNKSDLTNNKAWQKLFPIREFHVTVYFLPMNLIHANIIKISQPCQTMYLLFDYQTKLTCYLKSKGLQAKIWN